jgi:hypothetical protein
LSQAISPFLATSITAPATVSESMCFWVTASMSASFCEETPTDSGDFAIGSGMSPLPPRIAAQPPRSSTISVARIVDMAPPRGGNAAIVLRSL